MERSAREISSYSSTSIEGNPLPLTEVKKILKTKPVNIRNSQQEVLNYNQALKSLNELITNKRASLSSQLIINIHKQVMAKLLPDFDIGKLRQKPVVVNNPRSGQVIYLPPDIEDVELLINELIEFINNSKRIIDPIILAGIFHKQMVIIHPFIDGNGRTTRLATKVLLAEMGLNTFNLFSFENFYNQNVARYFQNVGEIGNYYDLKGKIDFTKWLEYFTEGIIDELLRVEKLLPHVPFNPETQLKPYHLKVIEYINHFGFIADRDYAKIVNRAKATRTQDFKRLIELGMIVRKGKGKGTYYVLKT